MSQETWAKIAKPFNGKVTNYLPQGDIIEKKNITDAYLNGGFCLAVGMLWLESRKKKTADFFTNLEKFDDLLSSQITRIMKVQAHQNVVMFSLLKKKMVRRIGVKVSVVITIKEFHKLKLKIGKIDVADDIAPVKNAKGKVFSPETSNGVLNLGDLFVNSYPWMDDSKIGRKAGHNKDVDRVIGNLLNHRRGWLRSHGLVYKRTKFLTIFEMDVMLDEITSSAGFKIFDTFGPGSGHTMACHVEKTKITYYDPNIGELEFTGVNSKRNFQNFYKYYTSKVLNYSIIQALYYVITFF